MTATPGPVGRREPVIYGRPCGTWAPSLAQGVAFTRPIPPGACLRVCDGRAGELQRRAGGTVTWPRGLAPGATVTVIVVVVPTSAGTVLGNSATVAAGFPPDPQSGNNSASPRPRPSARPQRTARPTRRFGGVVTAPPGGRSASGPQRIGDIRIDENGTGQLTTGSDRALAPPGMTFAAVPRHPWSIATGWCSPRSPARCKAGPGVHVLHRDPSATGPAKLRCPICRGSCRADSSPPTSRRSRPGRSLQSGARGPVRNAMAVAQAATPAVGTCRRPMPARAPSIRPSSSRAPTSSVA